MNRPSACDVSAWIPPLESDDSGLSDSEDCDGDFERNLLCEDESTDEDCTAPTSPSATTGTREIQWETVPQQNSTKDFPVWGGARSHVEEIKQPIQYFRYFFNNDVLELIVQQSNLFYFQQKHSALNLDQNELEQFLGTLLYMSVIQLPRSRLYWSAECRVAQVADIMSRGRWEEIKEFIHFNDNSNLASNNDKLYKIRPFINLLLTKFHVLPQNQMLSVHELIVPFKGKTNLKQYFSNKLYKWGYKIFVLCDTNGLVHSFDIFTGYSEPLPGEPDRGVGGNVVLKFAQVIPSSANHLLFFDSCFSSLDLLVVLANKGIPALGAMKQNRLPGCSFSKDGVMKKNGRGSFEEKKVVIESVEIRAVKWFNHRGLIVASTFASAQPVCQVERWDRKLKKTISVKCPSIISIYNQFKGGVNSLEALISNFPIQIKSRKFYHKLFFYFINMVIVNSWLLYQRDCDFLNVPKKMQKDFLDFRTSIAQALCLQGKDLSRKRSATKAIPTQEVRSDSVGHWPVMETVRQRCKRPNCKGLTVSKCVKCNVHLCLSKRKNCFRDFHEIRV
uniref:PiggyBac transposable element-derived protein domain-containing protein n=1 Tax=Periophthalmus magnuspinnatus TaxID=409849 RepID=A0A3B4A161_9GOBI